MAHNPVEICGSDPDPAACAKTTEAGTANVLLVTDKPGDADLVRLRLVESKFKFHVNCVSRLSDALACLEVETPSLVLVDPNLSDSRGAETVRRIMQKVPNVPVVILSGQFDDDLALKAVRQGVRRRRDATRRPLQILQTPGTLPGKRHGA